MNYKEVILSELLNKYEKSKSYLQDINRKIILKVDDLKEYDIENYDSKSNFHNVVKELKKKKIIDFKWADYEEENLLDNVWLIKENVEEAYKEIKRKNPKDEYKGILKEIEKQEFSMQWIIQFFEEMKVYMINKQKENALLPGEKAKDIIIALKEIDNMQNSEEAVSVLKRVFSIKCYRDSKIFERSIEKNLIKIVKKYYIKENFKNIFEKISDDEVLNEIGIVKYPEIIEFCGNMKCKIKGEDIYFSANTFGSYVNTYTIQNMENIEIFGVRKIIFIENKTNYINYITNKKEGELVIYHGGFYSPIKGIFFQKIYNASKKSKNEIQYYHWSDIDIGGFEIFIRLKENIIEELLPYNMDKVTLLKNEKSCKKFSEDYKHSLCNLREDNRYSIFFEVIDFMLKNNIRLEQESLV